MVLGSDLTQLPILKERRREKATGSHQLEDKPEAVHKR
jgi:hypothetical protein